jgi:hypothetical protein
VSDTGTRLRCASAAGYACGARGSGEDPGFSLSPAPAFSGQPGRGPLHVHAQQTTAMPQPVSFLRILVPSCPWPAAHGVLRVIPAQGRAVTPRGTLVWASAPFKRGGPARDRAPVGIQSRANAVTARRTSVCAALGASAPFSRWRPRLARSRREAQQLLPERWSVHPPHLSAVVVPGITRSHRKRSLRACLCASRACWACNITCGGVSSCRAETGIAAQAAERSNAGCPWAKEAVKQVVHRTGLPNQRFDRSAKQLRCLVPSSLRSSAPGQPRR